MDLTTFRRRLPALYADLHRSAHPRDRRLAHLCRAIPGLATENKLCLLNCAASLLEPGEVYVEVGVLFGLSMIGAMLGNERQEFFGIDDFSQFGARRDILAANVRRHVPGHRFTLLEGDCFELLASRDPFRGKRVGVYFYDGGHSYQAHVRALAMVERHLARRALVVVDDTSYPLVRRATAWYVWRHPAYRLMFALTTEGDRDPVWWNGVHVYGYRRRPGRRALAAALRRRLAESIGEPA